MSRKKKFEKTLYSDKDGIRFATPQVVAQYRAKRIKYKTLADISCGIGGQVIFFAKECDFVYAVEIDPQKIEYARKNCELHGIDNVEFICGDALSTDVIRQIPKVDIIFSDPARPAEENKRQVVSLEPGIPNVISAYSGKTDNFAFEAPPQMPPQRIPFDCEREYMSLNGQLNRLTLYFGNLKQCECSAVSLPCGAHISSTNTACIMNETQTPKTYAYEPEPSVIKADLLPQLAGSIKHDSGNIDLELFTIDKKRLLLTSGIPIRHTMLKNHYSIIQVTDFEPAAINSLLKKHDVGTVVLRAGVDPAEYWTIRNKIENGLSGKNTIHLFVKNKKAILCKVI
ncbi:MAG TPA: methyltransferase domain-containing protein [Methanosarcinaceae archaeon]|nr:methyltransferase domain-containing protein [Methanosarcinaceae archaeon]